ncbi:beta family protein [Shewanella sp. C32]|uniref:Beta family protein n=1 Tax=Shewanella electrica TaxID=515560 RepID=A0ABT2FKA1_9GAMM|nr:beta family protein [Shewanella electrica]MCH1924530.1 beta family protein [Shewanella electrica]MCS4556431.1 beta family protein [Shewanella electrica]
MSAIKPYYIPILSVSPSEIRAISELSEKDKDLLLPYFPLKGWLGANKLENSIKTISKSFKDRLWIADIDYEFLRNSKIIKKLLVNGEYPREVYNELIAISDCNNGYENWVEYSLNNTNIVPSLQLDELSELALQCDHFSKTDKKIAVRIKINSFTPSVINTILKTICDNLKNELFIIFDLEQVSLKHINNSGNLSNYIDELTKKCSTKKNCHFSISGTSFPSSFTGMSEGESSIYERIIFNKINNYTIDIDFIYSDYASVSLKKASGASRLPPPRIDYPRKEEWRHIRKDFDDVETATKEEKHNLYTLLAKKLLKKEYWDKDLLVWGTQQIEKTALGDGFGITDAQKATATRINIHLFQQLHYTDEIKDIDTDDDWVD